MNNITKHDITSKYDDICRLSNRIVNAKKNQVKIELENQKEVVKAEFKALVIDYLCENMFFANYNQAEVVYNEIRKKYKTTGSLEFIHKVDDAISFMNRFYNAGHTI